MEARLHWYAVHTRSRHERKVRAGLLAQGFEVYLPEFRTLSKRRDRRLMIFKSLFPGYLFIQTQLDPDQHLRVIKTPSVVRLVGVRSDPTPIPEHEIASIRLLLGADEETRPSDSLSVGQLVQVMEGPLRGVIGRVVDTAKARRIVVSVDLLGRAVEASLGTEAVEPYLE
jgi:transcriptional antiterminator NusG